jgi:hypothetical protein
MKQTAEYLFAVRLREDGTPWVALQPKSQGIEDLPGEIGLNLYRGTSLEEAKQLARFLNSNIKALSYESGSRGAS